MIVQSLTTKHQSIPNIRITGLLGKIGEQSATKDNRCTHLPIKAGRRSNIYECIIYRKLSPYYTIGIRISGTYLTGPAIMSGVILRFAPPLNQITKDSFYDECNPV
uniref:Uncharacterized protein n=1 Tax=Glossina brevipalpis TaxID=37001 RepID=A0A1A9WY13_9MUSC